MGVVCGRGMRYGTCNSPDLVHQGTLSITFRQSYTRIENICVGVASTILQFTGKLCNL